MPDLSSILDAALSRHQAGDLAEATRLYREVLAVDQTHPDALHMLGVIAQQNGNYMLALKLIEAALGQRDTMPMAWHNRSLILRLLGRKEDALQSAEQAVSLDPAYAEAWEMLGFLLRDQRDFERARTAYARAVALRPDDPKFLGSYASLLLATGELTQAYSILRAIGQRDTGVMAQTMGNLLKAVGYPDRAIPYYQKTRALLPDNDEVRVTEAMARLLMGDFTEGWKLWETRPSLDLRFQDVPLWRGENVGHLLVHEDQGLGDAFHFVRYMSALRPCAKRITLQVSRALHRVFAASFSELEILALEDAVPAADARVRLLSLPAIFAANAANIPAQTPYLAVSETWREPWRERLAKSKAPRTGLVWGGNPEHHNDRQRSIPFAQIAPLLQSGQTQIVSLQKGGPIDGDALAEAGIFDAAPFLGDFADTAGLLAELDLLISVDTSVAHMAGALGKPVWLMLPFDPDWRWLLGREDSPWYPSMRIFRQTEPRKWQEVIERVSADLRRLLAGDTSVLHPLRWHGENLRQNPLAIRLPD